MSAEYSKHAGFMDIFRNPNVQASLATTGVASAAAMAHSAYAKHQQTQEAARSYKSMLELHPRLQQRDANQVKRLFNSLSRVSPDMAGDPLVAGAWVDNLIEINSSTLGQDASNQALLASVKDMADIRNKMRAGGGQSGVFELAQKTFAPIAQAVANQGADRARQDLEQHESKLDAYAATLKEREQRMNQKDQVQQMRTMLDTIRQEAASLHGYKAHMADQLQTLRQNAKNRRRP